MRKKRDPLLLPHGVRALVPVLGVVGGAGRSTLAGLLAQVLAPTTRTVVIDPAVRASSPWAGWLDLDSAHSGPTHSGPTHSGPIHSGQAGLPGLLAQGADRRGPHPPALDPGACLASAIGRPVPVGRASREELLDVGPPGLSGPGYDVLADARPLTAPPVPFPEDPAWYAALVEAGGWFAGIIDFGGPLLTTHVRSRHAGRPSPLDLWWRRGDAAPVVAVPTTGDGLAAFDRLTDVAERDGLPSQRMLVGLVDVAGPAPTRRVRSGIAALTSRVAVAVRIPYDTEIRTHGLRRLDRVAEPVLGAASTLARSVASVVRPHRPEAHPPPPTTSPGWVPTRSALTLPQGESRP